MKFWFVLSMVLALAVQSFADTIKMRGARWDDLSAALNITPFYFEIQSETTARSVNLVLEVYQEGKQVERYQSGGMGSDHASPIDVKSALFFKPTDEGSEYSVTWTVQTLSGTGKSWLKIPKSVIDLKGMAFGVATTPIADSKKAHIGTIICNAKSGGFSMADTLDRTIAANPTATVIGVYLERE